MKRNLAVLKGLFDLSTDLVTAIGLLVTAIVMFAIGKPRLDAVALLMLVALPFTEVISVNDVSRSSFLIDFLSHSHSQLVNQSKNLIAASWRSA